MRDTIYIVRYRTIRDWHVSCGVLETVPPFLLNTSVQKGRKEMNRIIEWINEWRMRRILREYVWKMIETGEWLRG